MSKHPSNCFFFFFSKIRNEWLPFEQANPVRVEGQLDIEFALADQKRLTKEYQHRILHGKKYFLYFIPLLLLN